MKQSLPDPDSASYLLVWTRFLFCGHTYRITEGFCFGVSLPRTELMPMLCEIIMSSRRAAQPAVSVRPAPGSLLGAALHFHDSSP